MADKYGGRDKEAPPGYKYVWNGKRWELIKEQTPADTPPGSEPRAPTAPSAGNNYGLPPGYHWEDIGNGNLGQVADAPYENPNVAATEAKRAKVRESGSSRFWPEREAALPNVENYQQQREAARAAAETAWPRHRAKVRYNEWGKPNGWGLGRKI